MSLARRSFVISSLLMPLVTWADAYPSKPIEWVVPYAAGGGTDVVARVLSEPMGKALGQSIIVVNKPGAATNIGADAVARAKPDGYTILTGHWHPGCQPLSVQKTQLQRRKRLRASGAAGALSHAAGGQQPAAGQQLC